MASSRSTSSHGDCHERFPNRTGLSPQLERRRIDDPAGHQTSPRTVRPLVSGVGEQRVELVTEPGGARSPDLPSALPAVQRAPRARRRPPPRTSPTCRRGARVIVASPVAVTSRPPSNTVDGGGRPTTVPRRRATGRTRRRRQSRTRAVSGSHISESSGSIQHLAPQHGGAPWSTGSTGVGSSPPLPRAGPSSTACRRNRPAVST